MKNLRNNPSSSSMMASAASAGCPFASKAAASADDGESSKDGTATATATTAYTSGCPFAQTLHHDNDNSDDHSSSSSTAYSSASAMLSSPTMTRTMTMEGSDLPWKECPIFKNHSCPFKDAKSPDDVSEMFSRMLPASHMDQTRPTHSVLIETLAYFHRDQAMEEYSLSAIMSRLARKHHGDELDDNDDDDDHIDVMDDHIDAMDYMMRNKTEEQQQQKGVHALSAAASDTSTTDSEPHQARRLSEALKTGTEEAHKEAESVHFVKNFIQGKIDRRLYALFVAQMFHVYRRLENALDEHAPRNFPECHFPKELSRFEALREDIDFWQGDSGEPPISPATQDYLDRIDTVAKERPLLLLAHAYTRYLGDLSGGKILARVAKRALMLDSKGPDGLAEGLAFYDFPLLRGSVKAFKDRYRQALNDLQFDDIDEAVKAVVQEANVAFLLNMRLFEELDVTGSVPGATVRPLEEVYSHVAAMNENKGQDQEKQSPAAPCPFANMSGASAFQHLHNHSQEKEQKQVQQQVQEQPSSSHGKTCPWPFILLHDPKAGMRQWQTWLTIGLLLTFAYHQYVNHFVVV